MNISACYNLWHSQNTVASKTVTSQLVSMYPRHIKHRIHTCNKRMKIIKLNRKIYKRNIVDFVQKIKHKK